MKKLLAETGTELEPSQLRLWADASAEAPSEEAAELQHAGLQPVSAHRRHSNHSRRASGPVRVSPRTTSGHRAKGHVSHELTTAWLTSCFDSACSAPGGRTTVGRLFEFLCPFFK